MPLSKPTDIGKIIIQTVKRIKHGADYRSNFTVEKNDYNFNRTNI